MKLFFFWLKVLHFNQLIILTFLIILITIFIIMVIIIKVLILALITAAQCLTQEVIIQVKLLLALRS